MAYETMASRSSLDNLLRTVFRDGLRDLFNRKKILLQSIPRHNTDSFKPGEQISVALGAEGGAGFAFSDDLTLPAASHMQIERAYYDYKGLTDRIEIAGDLLEDSTDSRSAEKSVLDMEIKRVARDGSHDLNYHLFGNGDASVGVVDHNQTVTSNSFYVLDARGLRNNLRVDVLVTADGSVGGGVAGARITVNKTTGLVTLQDGAQIDDQDTGFGSAGVYTVYRQGSRNQGIWGLDAWVNDVNPPSGQGLLGRIDRSVTGNEFWNGFKLSNGGTPRAWSQPLMQEALDEIDQYGTGEPNLALCGHKVWAQIAAFYDKRRRTESDTMTLKGWAKALMFGELPMVRDKHCPADKMYLINTEDFRFWQVDEGKWMDRDGAILSRLPNKVAYQAGWFRRMNFICQAPNGQAVIEDLDGTAAVTA